MDKFLVSLVLAAKSPPREVLVLCLASFSALQNASRIQLVIVESGTPAELPDDAFAAFANVKRLEVPAEGVYAAYNAGIEVADGTYLLFFGVDDIALPGMDRVIEHLDTSPESYHLYAAPCYMQAGGIRRPSERRTSLIFANWCHQGIFYQRNHLFCNRYDPRYRVQADHKLNIDIVSNKKMRVGISQYLVAYFSAGGISSVSPDLVFRADFPKIVALSYGQKWGCLVRTKQILIDFLLGRPETRFKAREKH